VSAGQLIAFRVHGITREYIEQMYDLGFSDLDAGELLAFKIHGINERFVERMREIGYDSLSLDEALRLRIWGIDPLYADRMAELGLTGLTPNQLVATKILHVDAEFVAEMRGRTPAEISVGRILRDRDRNHPDDYDAEILEAVEQVIRLLGGR
jgi:hypothetical protein